MNGMLKKVGLGVALAATALTVAAPAEAQRYRGGHYYRGHGDAAGAALVGGLAGLAVGAALASDRPGYYYDGYAPAYYGPAYYGPAYYGPPAYYYGPRYRGYYGPSYRGYYRGGYRGGAYRGGYHGGGYRHR